MRLVRASQGLCSQFYVLRLQKTFDWLTSRPDGVVEISWPVVDYLAFRDRRGDVTLRDQQIQKI